MEKIFFGIALLLLVSVGLYLAFRFKRDVPVLAAFAIPLAFIVFVALFRAPGSMAGSLSADSIRTHWLAIHVPLIFLAYTGFAVAFSLSLVYLIQEHRLKGRLPSGLLFRLPALEELDNWIYRLIWWAFPVLTAGLLLGALWAHEEWGRYWGWDAKETWALITWLVYLGYLHMRVVAGWRGRKTVYLSIVGFMVVLFTYVGVNFFSQLHGFFPGGGQ